MADPRVRHARRQALRRLHRAESELEGIMAKVVKRLQRRLLRYEGDDIEAMVREELTRSLRPRIRAIRESVAEVAERGREFHLAEAAAALPKTGAVAAALQTLRESAFDSPAAAIIRGEFSVSGEGLAAMLVDVDAQIAKRLAAELTEARRYGESAIKAAKRLTRAAGRDLERIPPQYIQELADAVRDAPSRSTVKSIVRSFRKRMERTGLGGGEAVAGRSFTVRGASRRLLAQLERGAREDIGAAVDRWVQDRAVQRARLISRTEGSRAFREGYMRTARDNPYVRAWQYNLSRSHPQADICDVYAGQDLDGLGAGVYRDEGSFPSPPVHPACICFVTAKMVGPGQRELPQGEPTDAHEWMAQQPESKRREILGPTRARRFKQSPEDVMARTGEIRPVRALSGR